MSNNRALIGTAREPFCFSAVGCGGLRCASTEPQAYASSANIAVSAPLWARMSPQRANPSPYVIGHWFWGQCA